MARAVQYPGGCLVQRKTDTTVDRLATTVHTPLAPNMLLLDLRVCSCCAVANVETRVALTAIGLGCVGRDLVNPTSTSVRRRAARILECACVRSLCC